MEINLDWRSVCLACLQQDGEMFSIFEEDEKGVKHNEKILKCANIDTTDSNLPDQICKFCLNDLTAAYRFRINCENSNQIIKSFFGEAVKPKTPKPKNEIESNKSDISSLLLTPKKRYTKDAENRLKMPIKEEIPEQDHTYFDDTGTVQNAEDADEDIFPNLTEFLKKKQNLKAEQKISKEVVPVELISKPKTRSKIKVTPILPPKRKVGRPKSDTPLPGIFVNKIEKLNEKDGTVEFISKRKKIILPRLTNEVLDKNEKLVCDICGNTYKYANALRVHMLRHDSVKQFHCELCPKSFVADTDLKRHMRVHTGEKPYACKFCDRKFSDFGSRGKHERTHTGERPYECQTCHKTFTYSHVLTVHQLVHTGVKKFKCIICDKGFTKKLYLNNHMKQHLSNAFELSELEAQENALHMQMEHEQPEMEEGEEEEEEEYQANENETMEIQLQEATPEQTMQMQQPKSIYTLVKTESGLAEVQYFLPVG